jgi:hypothetical protein
VNTVEAYDASEDGGGMDPAISLAFLRSSQNEDSRLQRVRSDYGYSIADYGSFTANRVDACDASEEGGYDPIVFLQRVRSDYGSSHSHDPALAPS